MNERLQTAGTDVEVRGEGKDLKKTVLVVDDDTALLELVRSNLESCGYDVLAAIDAESAQWMLKNQMPDLVILDVQLPRMDGFELAKWIRGISSVPIIMLTVKTDEGDVVKGLSIGADDYVTKPFRVQELLARAQVALRRQEGGQAQMATAPVLDLGELVVDTVRRRVMVRGKEAMLTATEYKLLVEFASNPGKVLSSGELLSRVWGPKYKDELEYLRAYVRNLRKKIESDPDHPRYIHTRFGQGYVLEMPAA